MCRECGAGDQRGLTCREQWEELLALEFSDPRAGSVHFLTVACYQLQHPSQFPLRREARQQLFLALHDVVVHDRPVEDVRQQMGQRYGGAASIIAPDDEARAHRPTWSHGVADIGQPDADRHVSRVREWARAIYSDLAG